MSQPTTTTTTSDGFKGFGFKLNASAKAKPRSVILQPSKLLQLSSQTDEGKAENTADIDFVTSIDGGAIKGDASSSASKAKSGKSKPLVIPMIAINKYRIEEKKTETIDETTTTSHEEEEEESDDDKAEDIAAKAKRELLREAKAFAGDESTPKSIPAWKLMVINQVPTQYENDTKLDVSIRPESASAADYAAVPIEAFGAAMLRGMGWQDGAPIGGINQAITPVFEPQLRARGLGLGADVSLRKQLEETGSKRKSGSKDQEVPIRVGSHVCVEAGPCRSRYGTVQSIGDDMSHVSVRLTHARDNIEIPLAVLRVVSKEEFDRQGRVINKSKFDDYTNAINQAKSSNNNSITSSSSSNNIGKSSSQKSSKSVDRDRDSDSESLWIMPNIRAQIRDKHYRNGKYHKQKVIIVAVDSARRTCTCRSSSSSSSSSRTLEDVPQESLRTVIPKLSDDDKHRPKMMIVRGEHRGRLATLESIGRHDVTAKLIGTIGRPQTLSFDDISEYYNNRR